MNVLDDTAVSFTLLADKKRREVLLLESYLGLAACDIRMGNFQAALEASNLAVDISNGTSGSAFFRRAQVRE